MDDYLIDRVLLAVEQIPAGRVASYGDIGRLAGTSPRRVGTILKLYSGDAPWWRVVGASGEPGGNLLPHFRPHWQREGIALHPNGRGCRMSDFRADQNALAAAYRVALTALIDRASTPLPTIGDQARAALHRIGVTTLEHVIEHSEAELLALPGVETGTVDRLAAALAALGWGWSHRRPLADAGRAGPPANGDESVER